MHHSKFLHGFGTLAIIAIIATAGSFIVMGLWNSIITEVCGFHTVSFWQALGILTLGLTLSGGIFMLFAAVAHAVFGHHRYDVKRELFKKWHSMTDEQRREFLTSRGVSIEKKD